MALARRHILRDEDLQKPEPKKEDVLGKLLLEVDSPNTIARLERLNKIATRPLSLLNPEQCADLEAIRKLARSTYGTPIYATLHEKVTSLFAPEGRVTIYQPHTIGSFFTSCITPNNLTEIAPDLNPGCALTCPGALPSPDKTWNFCSQNVLWCRWAVSSDARNSRHAAQRLQVDHSNNPLDQTFDFIFITYIPSSPRAVIFMDYQTYDEFPGFTRHEKARLIHRLGITDVKLLSYDFAPDSMNYKDLLGKTIKVIAIKPRADPRDNESPAQRLARRSKMMKTAAPASTRDSAMTWQEAAALAVALTLLVLLGISAGFLISHIRKSIVTSRTRKVKWRT